MDLIILDASQQPNFLQEFGPIIMMSLCFLVMWFYFIRPRNKMMKEKEKIQSELKKGDKVVTSSGIHGKIVEIADHTVVIESYGSKIKIERQMIDVVTNG